MFLTLEPGIGYRGSFARFRAFESAYLQNFTYGSEHPGECINGHFYDRVIPNYFNPNDFPLVLAEGRDDYYLYIGRLIHRKGVEIAVKTVEAINGRLIVAGQGDMQINSPNVEMVGYVGPERRAELMGRARAVFVPTLYLEAFGGVNVEAQLCGTPVITTNYGVFPETVIEGTTGFCCNTLHDFVKAALKAPGLHPESIRSHALRYSMEYVMCEYQEWFDDIYQVYLSATVKGERGWSWLPQEVSGA